MSFIKVTNGSNLFYQDWGNGIPVIFVHGWCQSSDGWEYMMHDFIANNFRCIAYDQRGCGRSDQTDSGYEYHMLADDLAGLIEKLNLEKVILVGHSLGCGIITQYLANYGEKKVKKAVFIGTITPNFAKSESNPNGFDQRFLHQALAHIKRDRPGFVYSLVDDFFAVPEDQAKVSDHLADWIVGIALSASARAATELQVLVFTADQTEELKKISIPILILHGDMDSGPLELTAKPTHKYLRNSRLKIYPQRHHGMYITEPNMIASDIIDFITNDGK